MNNKYDVVIIGAGISGLVAGANIAKHGKKVLLIEKHNIVGGCYTSFIRNGFTFDAAAQLIGSCGKSDTFGSMLHMLGVSVDFVRLKTTDIVHYPNEVVKVDGDPIKFKKYLKHRFPDEADGLERFFGILSDADDDIKVLYVMKKYASMTYQQFLDSFFEDSILKSILSAQTGYVGLPPKKLAAGTAIFLLKTYIIDGACYPKGSSQVLSDAIADVFKKYGGVLLLGSEADEILVKGGRVKGVLVNGKEIASEFIILASDARHAYTKLLNPQYAKSDPEFSAKLTGFKEGGSCCILYLGVSKDADLKDKNGWYYPSYDINENFYDMINVHIPTKYDRSLSKSGDQILIATFFFDYKGDKASGRKEFKSKLINMFLDKLEKHIPGIKRSIIAKEIATPLTLERYTYNFRGSLYGWAQSPDQVHKNCFPINSPVKGLYHAGHWTLPGGGVVAVATSGMNASNRILKKIKMRSAEQHISCKG